MTLPLRLEPDTWLSLLEQSLLFLLILGRWFLPRGKLTRNQLSQLLFVYLGIASDVMELFILFEEPLIRQDRVLTLVTLGVWSVSLLQFCIILTSIKMTGRKSRAVGTVDITPREEPKVDDENSSACKKFLSTEIWSLMVSIALMDGPFLGVRLYALFRYRILSYGILFFSFKNLLMISLLIYRMRVVCCAENDDEKSDDDEDINEHHLESGLKSKGTPIFNRMKSTMSEKSSEINGDKNQNFQSSAREEYDLEEGLEITNTTPKSQKSTISKEASSGYNPLIQKRT